ncbi:MAG: thioredoxin family protein [Bryobacterales bacterium]|nr:thioredoxin family protein [Bryobacterales bacterium]
MFAALASAQTKHPVSWQLTAEPQPVAAGGTVVLRLTATIDEGWHLYSPTTPPGPIPTELKLDDNAAVASFTIHQPEPKKIFDPNFNNESQSYEKEVVFLIEAKLAATLPETLELSASTRYQVCSDTTCLRPVRRTAALALSTKPVAGATARSIPAGYTAVPAAGSAPPAETSAAPATTTAPPQSMLGFLAVAFGFGIASIFTPCVFPMIPFTVSAFLGGGGPGQPSGSSPLVKAITFCLGIILIFTALGIGATAALGPFGVVQIGSSPWVNGFITLVFVAFGLSLLGAFEITLPSGLVNRMNNASQGAGLLPMLLMGLTFALTSFACVGPFMGTLLAASVQGDKLQPALGMLSFATGLASPFFFLALFPGYLKNLPRSGGWLVRVKVVMGFLVLAAAVKYISTVDVVLHWDLFTRERVLASWMVLLAMPGLYLLGLLRMEGIKAEETVGVSRALLGALFLILSVSLLPGMFGAPLGELDAFLPSAKSTPFAGASSGPKLDWMKDDYAGALARAKAENKPLFVNFTGYACTNCKWMKSNMFTKPEIASELAKYVLVELYTDGTDAASETNRNLQEGRYQTVSIPHYVVLDGTEAVRASQVGLTKDTQAFKAFLTKGLGS